MNINDFDVVLVVEPQNINEDKDMRNYATYNQTSYYDSPDNKLNRDWDDPKLYQGWSFGKQIQQGIEGFGRGFFSSVTDLGKWVMVTIGYHNTITGREAKKDVLVVFKDNGDGYVVNTKNKWRSVSGVSQTLSYIRAMGSSLKNSTNGNI